MKLVTVDHIITQIQLSIYIFS